MTRLWAPPDAETRGHHHPPPIRHPIRATAVEAVSAIDAGSTIYLVGIEGTIFKQKKSVGPCRLTGNERERLRVVP